MKGAPTNPEEIKKWAGKWCLSVNMDGLDVPNGTKIIVGRETEPHGNIKLNCFMCGGDTYASQRDMDVIKVGAAPMCSSCYFKHLGEQ